MEHCFHLDQPSQSPQSNVNNKLKAKTSQLKKGKIQLNKFYDISSKSWVTYVIV